MIRYQIIGHIDQTPAAVYDFVAVHQPENHPRWEPEVLELRRDGPLAPGVTGVMVRKDFGRVTHNPIVILDCVQDRRVRFASDANGVRFDLALDLEPAAGGTKILATVEVTITGMMRLLEPLLAAMFRKNSEKILKRLPVAMREVTATSAAA